MLYTRSSETWPAGQPVLPVNVSVSSRAVTAEGVEDLTALAMLRDLGCDQVQGFALAHPVPEAVLLAECLRAEAVARAVLMDPAPLGPRQAEHRG